MVASEIIMSFTGFHNNILSYKVRVRNITVQVRAFDDHA